MRFRVAVLSSLALIAACAPAIAPSASAPPSALRGEAMKLPRDPTVWGSHVVPLAVREDRSLGIEPGGGVRALAAGVRVVTLPAGAIEVADDRFPSAPNAVVSVPDRLGGGFLFVVNESTIWRADRWLGRARPIHQSYAPIAQVVAGLDRAYVRTQAGAWRAIDARTGERLALGPWPAAPTVTSYAAADGWRALAIADLRGPIATFDAGATWIPVRVPLDAREAAVAGESLVVKGNPGRGEQRFEVRPDGQVLRSDAPSDRPPAASDATANAPLGPLGPRPIEAAVEDGWPLDDGTALVARDGALARVRLEDGAVVDVAQGAYELRPSRCHPILLGDGVGFVCGEPRGATALYSLDPARGRLDELRRWDGPRAIVASGNGAIAVHGACAAAEPDARATHAYCVRSREGAWREIRVEGAVGGERVVALRDGRFVIVSPPLGDLNAARLTILEGERARSVPVTFGDVGDDVLRVLDVGVWLDGVEERRPGVLGAWVEAAGTMLGVEITLDGHAKVGAYVRDAGLPMVSGRYGLGWSGQRKGYETTDGGMTWTGIDLPEPIAAARSIASRACGPIGCSAAGWLRVGWGPPRAEPPPPAPIAQPPLPRAYAALPLACEATGSAPAKSVPAAPPAGPEDRVITYDVSDVPERNARFGPIARVSIWGPKNGEWDHTARWQARWTWPFGTASESRATVPTAAPTFLVDVARLGGLATLSPYLWSIAPGDDATHALLIAHRHMRSDVTLVELEADRTPVEIRRADGEPFAELTSAIRAGGRWWLLTPSRGERSDDVVWQVEAGIARELARVPRATSAVRPASAHLAWRTDGRALGVVVDGQPSGDRAGVTRWVLAIDAESGALGDVEPLGAADFSDRAALGACTGDEVGWRLDAVTSFPIDVAAAGGEPLGAVHATLARMVVGESRACVARISAAIDADLAELRRPLPPGASISATIATGRERRAFRCVVR